MKKDRFIISLDGNSSTGKSSLSKRLAKELSFTHIDSGAMYRAVTLFALRNGIIKGDSIDEPLLIEKLSSIEVGFELDISGSSVVVLNGEKVENDIRGMQVSRWVSEVAKIPMVRQQMVLAQRKIAFAQKKGVIMDGRDIGTTVFPDADVKLFLVADAEIRAKRRYQELMQSGKQVSLDEVIENIKSRDFLDVNRSISPLTKPNGAEVIDNSQLNFQQTFELALSIIKEKLSS